MARARTGPRRPAGYKAGRSKSSGVHPSLRVPKLGKPARKRGDRKNSKSKKKGRRSQEKKDRRSQKKKDRRSQKKKDRKSQEKKTKGKSRKTDENRSEKERVERQKKIVA